MQEIGKTDEYFDIGFKAFKLCETYISFFSRKEDLRILDFPCRYGRVLRHFRQNYPKATIFGFCKTPLRLGDKS